MSERILFDVIDSNNPLSEKWAGTFCQILTDNGVWDSSLFDLLLYDIRQALEFTCKESAIDRNLARSIFFVYSRLTQLITAHKVPSDYFEIQGISDEELVHAYEMFECAVTDFFEG